MLYKRTTFCMTWSYICPIRFGVIFEKGGEYVHQRDACHVVWNNGMGFWEVHNSPYNKNRVSLAKVWTGNRSVLRYYTTLGSCSTRMCTVHTWSKEYLATGHSWLLWRTFKRMLFISQGDFENSNVNWLSEEIVIAALTWLEYINALRYFGADCPSGTSVGSNRRPSTLNLGKKLSKIIFFHRLQR